MSICGQFCIPMTYYGDSVSFESPEQGPSDLNFKMDATAHLRYFISARNTPISFSTHF